MKKTKAAEKDEEFYQHMQKSLLYHQVMLRDEARNLPFYEALKRTVTPDSRVLDIGSGSGIWAVTAARLGAKNVTAVEENTAMVPVIMAHARENRVADRIKIVNGNSQEINLKERYDIIVSETIGNEAFEEFIVPTMVDARERFLAPGGVLIPQRVALVGTPIHLASETKMPAGVPITSNYLQNLALNISGKIGNRTLMEPLGEPIKLAEVDLRECDAHPNVSGLSAEWKLNNLSRANAIALSAEAELTDGVVLDTWNTASWMPLVCRFRPFEQKKGWLRFNLSIDSKLYHWTVCTDESPMPQAYTPVFAYTKLKLDSRFAPRRSRKRVR